VQFLLKENPTLCKTWWPDTPARQKVVDSLKSLFSADQSQYDLYSTDSPYRDDPIVTTISANELHRMSESSVDPNSTLLASRGKIYRVLEAEYMAQCREADWHI